MGRVRVLITIILTLAVSAAPAEPGAEPDPGEIESEARALMTSGDFRPPSVDMSV